MKKTTRRPRPVMTPEEEKHWYDIYSYLVCENKPTKTFAEFKTDVLDRLRIERRTPFRRYRYDKAFYEESKARAKFEDELGLGRTPAYVEWENMGWILSHMNQLYRWGFVHTENGKGFWHPSNLNP